MLTLKEEACEIAKRLSVPQGGLCFGRIPSLRPLDLADRSGRLSTRA
jgi:hypothetical protein